MMRIASQFSVLLLILTAGCSSTNYVITPQETAWPDTVELTKLGVVEVAVSTEKREQVPCVAPMKDQFHGRFLHEAVAKVVSYTEAGLPMFTAGEGLVMTVLYLEVAADDLGERPRQWAEVFTYDKAIMAQLKRGSVSVNQVGWSIFTPRRDGKWQAIDREAERNQHPFWAWWSKFKRGVTAAP